MNKNVESHFSLLPSANISRSSFYRPCGLKTTFNAGYLVPIFVDEVLPGDTFSLDFSMIVRQSTSIHPTMDNAYIDTYFFYIPFRILWENYEKFEGANDDPWTQTTDYEMPQLNIDAAVETGSLLDYFGIPVGYACGVDSSSNPTGTINRLYISAYQRVIDDWFRDENLESVCGIDTSDNTLASSAITFNGLGIHKADSLFKVAKYHDYFTSALPQPQKHGDVLLPLGSSAPVFAGSTDHNYVTGNSLRFIKTNGGSLAGTGGTQLGAINGVATMDLDTGFNGSTLENVTPSNLYADLTKATAATVNQLRLAIQTQRLFEKDARAGTRMTEILRSHFGIFSPDSRLQRAEYLGGKRTPINIDQVVQTSETSSTPLGNLAGYGKSVDRAGGITKSFVERGILLGLACVRTDHTYAQGIERFWFRKKRLDYYLPTLAHLGEMPILNREIYAQGGSNVNVDEQVFGYQEAWADYRYKPNRVSSFMRPGVSNTLASWNYADQYASKPTLGSTWIKETTANIDRTLAFDHTVAHQYIADFYFNLKCVRPMPVYSIPGLMDHF